MSDATGSSNLSRLFHGLEALYGADSGLDPEALLLPFVADGDGAREHLLMHEAPDGALELGLAIDERTLLGLESGELDAALSDDALGETLPVLEGLSHLVYIAEAARRERPVSGLELETQAEVDKLAMCLLHRWPDARVQFERLVDRLYYRFELVACAELHERYQTANRLALAFSRRLRGAVQAGRQDHLRRLLQRFWGASMTDKLALAA
ncbi:MAG: hypothetical protein IAG13_29015 [Deltaproteobacteria bacterium]|nr:hypothetical protein [Nannocystaceae bacterium]